MTLSEWAEQEVIHYQSAWQWFRDKLPVPLERRERGRHGEGATDERDKRRQTVLSGRVSPHDQRSDLDQRLRT